jgi:predicted metalloprotease with PDZ domain
MKIKIFITILFIVLTSNKLFAQEYTLSFPEPQTHYVNVDFKIDNWRGGNLDIKLPVWAPGSYLVREFSKNLEGLTATQNGNQIKIIHKSKNWWQLTAAKGSVVISYKIYANELSVRTSFVDIDHAYLNGSSVFLYTETLSNKPISVRVIPHPSWKNISVALNPISDKDPWTVTAPNYDELIDAPFEIGNQTVIKFDAAGVKHEVAMFGEGNFIDEKIKNDISKIVNECVRIFGSHPCKRYVFIVHNLTAGGGGLEHLNSSTLQTNRWSYGNESSYAGFLSLVAHEYFHLWNVKRLRPIALGPFDYSNENYTNMLYVAEGFTAYYDDLIAKRCGFYSESQYLDKLAESISYCVNHAGASVQPVSESSFDAWIKFYRPNENSSNATVSYYTKGSIIGAMLDFIIRKESDGKLSLDDLMKEMYIKYAVQLNRGYTDREFMDMASKFAGKDLSAFFANYVYDVKPIPFAEYLNGMGLEIVNLYESTNKSYWGVTTSTNAGKVNVTVVKRNSPAWKGGINVNDEIIALNNYRAGDDLAKLITNKKVGDTIKVLVSRSGYLRTFDIVLTKDTDVDYSLIQSNNVDTVKSAIYKKWLAIP